MWNEPLVECNECYQIELEENRQSNKPQAGETWTATLHLVTKKDSGEEVGVGGAGVKDSNLIYCDRGRLLCLLQYPFLERGRTRNERVVEGLFWSLGADPSRRERGLIMGRGLWFGGAVIGEGLSVSPQHVFSSPRVLSSNVGSPSLHCGPFPPAPSSTTSPLAT